MISNIYNNLFRWFYNRLDNIYDTPIKLVSIWYFVSCFKSFLRSFLFIFTRGSEGDNNFISKKSSPDTSSSTSSSTPKDSGVDNILNVPSNRRPVFVAYDPELESSLSQNSSIEVTSNNLEEISTINEYNQSEGSDSPKLEVNLGTRPPCLVDKGPKVGQIEEQFPWHDYLSGKVVLVQANDKSSFYYASSKDRKEQKCDDEETERSCCSCFCW